MNNVNHVPVLFFFFWKSYLRTEHALMINFSLEGNRSSYFFLDAAAMYWLGINLGNSTQLSVSALVSVVLLLYLPPLKFFWERKTVTYPGRKRSTAPGIWNTPPLDDIISLPSICRQWGNVLSFLHCPYTCVLMTGISKIRPVDYFHKTLMVRVSFHS